MNGAEEKDNEVAYKPGDVILPYEEPFAKILNEECKGKRCDNCFKEATPLLKCSACKLMFYCDRKCQSKDWKHAHSVECKMDYFKLGNAGLGGIGSSEFNRQMSRLHAILKLQKEEKSYTMYDGTNRSFSDLISHHENLEDDPKFAVNVFLMARTHSLEPPEVGISVEEHKKSFVTKLFRNAGIWKTNGISLLNEAQTAVIGSALFIKGSYFDHSCRPTAVTNFKGIRAEVRAIAPIKKGERAYVSYLSGHRPRRERVALLMARYNFDCKCPLCAEEEVKGDVISYDGLKKLQQSVPAQVTWKNILDLGQREVNLMRKCYLEYDERISNKFFVLLQEVAGLEAPKMILKKLANEAEEHLKLTFGVECADLVGLRALRRQHGIL